MYSVQVMLYKNVPWCRECCRRVWKIVVKHKGIVLILSGWGKKLGGCRRHSQRGMCCISRNYDFESVYM